MDCKTDAVYIYVRLTLSVLRSLYLHGITVNPYQWTVFPVLVAKESYKSETHLVLKKHWDCVVNPPGTERLAQVDHFNAFVMELYTFKKCFLECSDLVEN